MATNDMLKWVTSDEDFYNLLGLSLETCSESELRRAYRKTALKYHPDKLGKEFDQEKYELFQAAFEVLSDAGLKAQYDHHRQAKIQRQRANDLFEGRRRHMKEDLEAREKAGRSGKIRRPRDDEAAGDVHRELKRLAAEGKKRRLAREAMMAKNTTVPSV